MVKLKLKKKVKKKKSNINAIVRVKFGSLGI